MARHEIEALADDRAEPLLVDHPVIGRRDDHLRFGIVFPQPVGGVGDGRRGIAADRLAENLFLADLGKDIADQLLVGRQSLPTGALQAALRREVGVYHHEILRHHIVPDGLEQKALATAVFSHDEAEGCAPVGDNVHIPQQSVNLVLPSHGNVRQADTGNDAAFQGVYQRLSNSFWYFHG